MNLVILGAIVAHIVISSIHPLAGAILGFVLTTAVLLWGLSIYAGGGVIAFFAWPVSQAVFIGLCALWYVWDVVALRRALRARRLRR